VGGGADVGMRMDVGHEPRAADGLAVHAASVVEWQQRGGDGARRAVPGGRGDDRGGGGEGPIGLGGDGCGRGGGVVERPAVTLLRADRDPPSVVHTVTLPTAASMDGEVERSGGAGAQNST
jgi:hypothetical protein